MTHSTLPLVAGQAADRRFFLSLKFPLQFPAIWLLASDY